MFNKWNVYGNKKIADELANFLINCNSSKISVLGPFFYQVTNAEDFLNLDYPLLNYGKFMEGNKKPEKWSEGKDFFVYREIKPLNFSKDAKVRLVNYLKEFDKEKIPLPFFEGLQNSISLFQLKFDEFKRLSIGTNKISELVEKDFFIVHDRKNVSSNTLEHLHLYKEFEHKLDDEQYNPNPVTFNGAFHLEKEKIYLEKICSTIDNAILFNKVDIVVMPYCMRRLSLDSNFANPNLARIKEAEFYNESYTFKLIGEREKLKINIFTNPGSKNYFCQNKFLYDLKELEDLTFLLLEKRK
ncbi:MAG: hypothetical protein ACOYT4_02780 [Nanoarchaeota archaeon]